MRQKNFQSNAFNRYSADNQNADSNNYEDDIDDGFKPSQPQHVFKNDFNPFVHIHSNGNSVSDQSKDQSGNPQTNNYNHNFRPFDDRIRENDFFAPSFKSTTKSPQNLFNSEQYFNNQPPQQKHKQSDSLPDNFSYYHLGPKKQPNERDNRKINGQGYYNKIPNVAVVPNATPKNHFVSFSTVGGFFNNHQATTPANNFENYKQFSKIRNNYNAQNQGGSASASFDSGEGNRFVTNDFFPSGLSNQYSTTPRPRQYYTSTSPRFEPSHQQNDEDFYPSVGTRVKPPARPELHLLSGEGTTEPAQRYLVSQFTDKSFPYYEKTTTRPTTKLGPTRGPVVGVPFDFNKFIESIRQEQIANQNSNQSPNEGVGIFSTKLNALPGGAGATDFITKSTPRPFYNTNSYSNVGPTVVPSTRLRNTNYETTTLDSDEYYYDDEEEPTTRVPTIVKKFTTSRPTLTTTTTATTIATTTKEPKGYEGFIKSIPKQTSIKLQPIPVTDSTEEEGEDDEYYYDDDEDVFHVPPTNKYMPMTETRAPRPTPTYNAQRVPPSRHTTVQPIRQFYQTTESSTEIPSILHFPKDIFQDFNPVNHYLQNSTIRANTQRTRLSPATDSLDTETTTLSARLYTSPDTPTKAFRLPTTTRAPIKFSSSTRPMTTQRPTTTTRKVYTIRPYRGQPKWKNQPTAAPPATKTVRTGDKQNLLDVDDKKVTTNR